MSIVAPTPAAWQRATPSASTIGTNSSPTYKVTRNQIVACAPKFFQQSMPPRVFGAKIDRVFAFTRTGIES
jgi:hypothetical protein